MSSSKLNFFLFTVLETCENSSSGMIPLSENFFKSIYKNGFVINHWTCFFCIFSIFCTLQTAISNFLSISNLLMYLVYILSALLRLRPCNCNPLRIFYAPCLD